MKRLIQFVCCIVCTTSLLASNEKAYSYIDKYKDIAISEMRRSGIPASIKLAQGMLESQWGESELATKANNHFGIKCGSQWAGPSFYRMDDDYDANGNKVESCFRSYDDARSSYISHTEFLQEPRKQSRYGFLFSYASDDYESWAKGLRQAGYATDPKYPDKLIATIQKFGLDAFDERLTSKDLVNNSLPGAPVLDMNVNSASKSEIHHQGLKYILADGKSTAEQIANHYKLTVRQLLAYNETILVPSDVLDKGEIIYLEQKKREFEGDISAHYVKQGETIASISQLYGMRATSLRAINKLSRTEEVSQGQVIYLTPGSVKKASERSSDKQDRKKSKKNKKAYLFEW